MVKLSFPQSWSDLTWQQLCRVWYTKLRYSSSADVARVAAWLDFAGLNPVRRTKVLDIRTGEPIYSLQDKAGQVFTATARTVAQIAKAALPWIDYPYGDPGEEAVKDEEGEIVKPARQGVNGYVSGMRDALILPQTNVGVGRRRFALPQVACNNLTWQQYRALQSTASQLFIEGISDDDALQAQAEFLAHCLVPRSFALLDTTGGSIRLRPHYEYRYNAEQADELAKFWNTRLKKDIVAMAQSDTKPNTRTSAILLFHICFQTYQTALAYYSEAYPLLFDEGGKHDTMSDALQGEVGTINTVMKYAGYSEQQQVYDSNLPFVLDILNTMSREAKQIEEMNGKAKR